MYVVGIGDVLNRLLRWCKVTNDRKKTMTISSWIVITSCECAIRSHLYSRDSTKALTAAAVVVAPVAFSIISSEIVSPYRYRRR